MEDSIPIRPASLVDVVAMCVFKDCGYFQAEILLFLGKVELDEFLKCRVAFLIDFSAKIDAITSLVQAYTKTKCFQ